MLKPLAATAALTAALALPVAAQAQTITIVNQANVPAAAVRTAEQTLTIQARQLRQWWHTPTIQFAPGGWQVTLTSINDPRLDSNAYHSIDPAGTPLAVVAYEPGWQRLASHELLEMLADPQATARRDAYDLEVCDPVEQLSYRIAGIRVADFVTPAWFSRGRGPYDQLGRVHHARSIRYGYATINGPAGSHELWGWSSATTDTIATGSG